jgi:hypothetical protein
MERSVDETAAPRFRTHLAGAAPPWEVAVVAVVAIAVWRFTLGWNWSSIATADPVRTVAPQSDLDWIMLALAVAVAVGWLAWRGWPVVGALAIWAPIIVLSGWRLAVAGVLGWPISLASLIFVLSALCIVAGGAGAWLRHRSTSPDSDADYDDSDDDARDYDATDYGDRDYDATEPVPAEPITY